ncbi:hypothetical protein LCM27_01820 [Ruegeria marisrubri]|uniref:hypothetical protein n=1 Tax=Ruegeria marisrubri TaxID=1685379 RepID=UPI001CD208A3|nr:hypothetical protein [Ruegeria marisrubri]MCA0905130.1 hypothetical protein [Ruegeria marisrubri]
MAPPAILLGLIFFLAVRIGGQFGSFEYRDCYADIDEVRGFYGKRGALKVHRPSLRVDLTTENKNGATK